MVSREAEQWVRDSLAAMLEVGLFVINDDGVIDVPHRAALLEGKGDDE